MNLESWIKNSELKDGSEIKKKKKKIELKTGFCVEMRTFKNI